MAKPTGTMRHLQYPLNLSLAPDAITPDEPINEKVLDWATTDNDEKVTVTLTLSLNEYVALASCVDVGSDIAYGENAILLWFIWVRSINSMAFCDQVNDCITTNLSTQIALNNTLLGNGFLNPDQIQPIDPQMQNRFPESQRDNEAAPPPDACDNDALWAGILEIVERLDQMGLDFLEKVTSANDTAERVVNLIDSVPIFGGIVADVLTNFTDIAQDIENAYVAHSSIQEQEELACKLFELVCNDCRYPTYDEFYELYSNAGITGIQDIQSYGVTAALDYIIGSNGLANAVVWYTLNTIILYTLYLGSTFAGKRGVKWLEIWADIGEDAPSNGWELLCEECANEWCYEFEFDDAAYWVAGGRASPIWTATYSVGQWQATLGSNAAFTIHLPLPLGTIITEIQYQSLITGGQSGGPGLSFQDTDVGSDTGVEIVRENGDGQTHGLQTYTYPIANYEMVNESIQFHISGSASGNDRTATVYRIRLTGVGVDPMLSGTVCP